MRSYTDPKRLPRRTGYYSRFYEKDSGRRGWVSLTATTLKEARQRVATLRMEEAMGHDRVKAAAAAERALGESLDAWLAEKTDKVSAARLRVYAYQVDFFAQFFSRSTRLREITSDDVRAFLRKRKAGLIELPPKAEAEGDKKKKRRKRGVLSVTSINDELQALGSFFLFCQRNGWLDRSPTLGVERYRGALKTRLKSLTAEQEEALLRACRVPVELALSAKRNKGGRKGGKSSETASKFSQKFPPPPYLYSLVLTALRSGLRKRALLSARWRDADFEAGRWRLPGSFMKTGKPYEQPIAPSVVAALKEYRAALLEKHGTLRVAPDAAIFGLAPSAHVGVAFRTACKRAGIEGLNFHGLRAAFLNDLRARDVPINVAMELTGHESLDVVMRHYRRVAPAATTAALAALDGGAPASKPAESAADSAKSEGA